MELIMKKFLFSFILISTLIANHVNAMESDEQKAQRLIKMNPTERSQYINNLTTEDECNSIYAAIEDIQNKNKNFETYKNLTIKVEQKQFLEKYNPTDSDIIDLTREIIDLESKISNPSDYESWLELRKISDRLSQQGLFLNTEDEL